MDKFKEVEKLQIEILGFKHPDTLTTQSNIANCLDDLGKFDEALDKYKEVEKLQIEILGYQHPDTLKTQNNIALSCLEQ